MNKELNLVKANPEYLKKLFIMPDSPDKFIEFGQERLEMIHDFFKEKGTRIVAIAGTAGTAETGSVDPLDGMGDLAREAGTHFHVDARWEGGAASGSRQSPDRRDRPQGDRGHPESHRTDLVVGVQRSVPEGRQLAASGTKKENRDLWPLFSPTSRALTSENLRGGLCSPGT